MRREVGRIRLTFGTLASRRRGPQELRLDEGIVRLTGDASNEVPRMHHLSRFSRSDLVAVAVERPLSDGEEGFAD